MANTTVNSQVAALRDDLTKQIEALTARVIATELQTGNQKIELAKMNSIINTQELTIANLNAIIAQHGTSTQVSTALTATSWNQVVSKNAKTPQKNQQQIDMIGTIAKESKERENRSKNIVIQGINNSTSSDQNDQKHHDQTEINKVLDLIGADKDKYLAFFRLNPRESVGNPIKTRPLVITLPSESDRNHVLKQSSLFFRVAANRANYTTLFINPDLTAVEKNLAWQLRTECKKQNASLPATSTTLFVIRNNKIKEITKTR
jgi:hypothetical protein